MFSSSPRDSVIRRTSRKALSLFSVPRSPVLSPGPLWPRSLTRVGDISGAYLSQAFPSRRVSRSPPRSGPSGAPTHDRARISHRVLMVGGQVVPHEVVPARLRDGGAALEWRHPGEDGREV